MLKFAVYSRKIKSHSLQVLSNLINLIRDRGGNVLLYETILQDLTILNQNFSVTDTFSSFDDLRNKADFLISVGGDGSLLDTIALIRNSNIPILGINLGKLGFLSGIKSDEIEKAINSIFLEEYEFSERTLIHFRCLNNHDTPELNFALNDITVSKKDTNSMITVHAFVNDVHLNSYWSDGLIIATPTGSTAYSLSCLGPILTPDSHNLIINPIAPHNLSVRPIIIPDTSTIKLITEGRNRQFNLTVDSKTISLKTGTQLEISKEDFTIKLVNFAEDNFFQIIRDKLLWGSDKRNWLP